MEEMCSLYERSEFRVTPRLRAEEEGSSVVPWKFMLDDITLVRC